MKHPLLIFLILLISCQREAQIETLIKEQYLFLDSEYSQLIEDILVKSLSNPQKYNSFNTDLLPLTEKIRNIEMDILNNDKIDKQVILNISDYFSQLIEMFEDQDAKKVVLQQKENWVNHLKSQDNLNKEKKNLLLTQMKIIENYSLRAIISQYHKYDYNFNKLYPVVIENKKVLNKGEIYTANIVMAGIDTTIFPIIKINEKEIPINKKGQGVLKIQTDNIGTYKWNGVVKLFNDDSGIMKIFLIESDYTVK